MTNLLKFFATCALGLGLTSTAFAQGYYTRYHRGPAATGGDFTNEIATNLTNGYFTSEKACKDCSTGSVLDLSGSYLRFLQDGFQVGGEARIRSLSKEVSGTGDSQTLLDIAAVGAYNFQSDLRNSVYAKAGIGIFSALKNDRSDYENKLGVFIGAGKRFDLFPAVTYTPELRLVKKGDIDVGIELALLNFSIHWD